jgi:hypothetical protein
LTEALWQQEHICRTENILLEHENMNRTETFRTKTSST